MTTVHLVYNTVYVFNVYIACFLFIPFEEGLLYPGGAVIAYVYLIFFTFLSIFANFCSIFVSRFTFIYDILYNAYYFYIISVRKYFCRAIREQGNGHGPCLGTQ